MAFQIPAAASRSMKSLIGGSLNVIGEYLEGISFINKFQRY